MPRPLGSQSPQDFFSHGLNRPSLGIDCDHSRFVGARTFGQERLEPRQTPFWIKIVQQRPL
jgi:hypothetical protein